ncbi:hypothetical protein MANES_18G105750v8 [Manihot esculenta]|uniref:Uncharacterized protein n=1 Tax=Manihot esculenta TaxID=3983 RepID=A0ACB7G0K4_MANES|nr:hypothetical protein MANES_18G105750v8 [Manihot esculenta]
MVFLLVLKAETLEDLYEWKTALENALAQAPNAALVMGQMVSSRPIRMMELMGLHLQQVQTFCTCCKCKIMYLHLLHYSAVQNSDALVTAQNCSFKLVFWM